MMVLSTTGLPSEVACAYDVGGVIDDLVRPAVWQLAEEPEQGHCAPRWYRVHDGEGQVAQLGITCSPIDRDLRRR